MSTETEHVDVASGWTVDTLKILMRERRDGDLRVERERERFYEERDRRYTEVAVEREKALKIKEAADEQARALAREQQTYKDEQANNLRAQIERERRDYPTRGELIGAVEKIEATVKPLSEFVTEQRGRTDSRTEGRAQRSDLTTIIGGIVALALVTLAFYTATQRTPATPATPSVITVTTGGTP